MRFSIGLCSTVALTATTVIALPSPLPGLWDFITGNSVSNEPYPVYIPKLKDISHDVTQVVTKLTKEPVSCAKPEQVMELKKSIKDRCQFNVDIRLVHYIAFSSTVDNLFGVIEVTCTNVEESLEEFSSVDRFITGSFQGSPNASAFVDSLRENLDRINQLIVRMGRGVSCKQ